MTGTPLDLFAKSQVYAFALVFSRVGTAVLFMPGFGEASIPQRVRLVVALCVTFCVFPLTPVTDVKPPETVADLLLGLGVEFLAGAYLGIGARIVFSAVHTAGQLIATSIGLTALVPPPANGMEAGSPVTNLLTIGAVVVTFASGAHIAMIKAALGTYGIIAAGVVPDLAGLAQNISRLVGETFMLATQFAAPFIVLSLLFNIGLGLVNRVMPALPVYFVGTPVALIGGLVLVSAVGGAVLIAFLRYFADWLQTFGL